MQRTDKMNRPAWWQLYLFILGILGLLAWGALAHLSERGHAAAAIGTVLLAWVVVEVWLRANRQALLHVEGLYLVEQPDSGVAPAAGEEASRPALRAGLTEAGQNVSANAFVPGPEAGPKDGGPW